MIFVREKLYHLQKASRLCNSTIGNTQSVFGCFFNAYLKEYSLKKKEVALILIFFACLTEEKKSLNFILKMHFFRQNSETNTLLCLRRHTWGAQELFFTCSKKVPFWHANVIYLKPWDVNLAQIKSSSTQWSWFQNEIDFPSKLDFTQSYLLSRILIRNETWTFRRTTKKMKCFINTLEA